MENLFLYAFNNGKLIFSSEDYEERFALELNSDDIMIYADNESYTVEELEELGTVTRL
jgi:hypothetical protein